jgi:DNA-binding IclR family transcriptional regulator
MILSSVKKAFKILEVFKVDHSELGVTEISSRTSLDKSAVSRILMTLAAAGYLEKNESNKRYRLSWKLVDLGNVVSSRYSGIRALAEPFLEELARRTDEIVHLGVLDKNEVVHLDKKGREQGLTVGTRVGGRAPAHGSSLGKVLMSELPEKEILTILGRKGLVRLTKKTITEIPSLLEELRKVKRQGFAFDDEECHDGIQCVGAPIKDGRGNVVAAISTSIPKLRMGRERVKEIRRLVIETARLISERITLNTS